MTTETDLARLLAICDAATPGPWEIEREELPEDFGDALGAPTTIGPLLHVEHTEGETSEEACRAFEADAVFIVTFSPGRVRALLEERAEALALVRTALGFIPDQATDETGQHQGFEWRAQAIALARRTGGAE